MHSIGPMHPLLFLLCQNTRRFLLVILVAFSSSAPMWCVIVLCVILEYFSIKDTNVP